MLLLLADGVDINALSTAELDQDVHFQGLCQGDESTVRISTSQLDVLVSRTKAEWAQVLKAGVLQILNPAFAQANLERNLLMTWTMQAQVWLTQPHEVASASSLPKAINSHSTAQHSTAPHSTNNGEEICCMHETMDSKADKISKECHVNGCCYDSMSTAIKLSSGTKCAFSHLLL